VNLYLHCAIRLHGLLFNWAEARPVFIVALPRLDIFVDLQVFLLMCSAGCLRHVTETPRLQRPVKVLPSLFI
jgi:hypothetical protein